MADTTTALLALIELAQAAAPTAGGAPTAEDLGLDTAAAVEQMNNPGWLRELVDYVGSLSGTVWVAVGVIAAFIIWMLKWAVTVLFVQGRGVSLITIPFSRVAGKILEDRFAQRLADTKALPKLHVPGSWEEFNRFNGYVAHRMRTYRELVHLVQTQFNGPSAVSLRLTVRYFEPNFVETFRTAERGFRDLDRIDDKVRSVHRALHDELQDATDELERERILAEKDHEMIRIRRKHAVANRPTSLSLRRRFGQFFGSVLGFFVNWLWSSREAKTLKRERREIRNRLNDLKNDIAEQQRVIFAAHEAEVAGVCLELIEHDRMFLQHLYHRFGLEVESLGFTVHSGRLLELLAGDDERAVKARTELGLDAVNGFHCPGSEAGTDLISIRSCIRSDPDLQAYVGLGPEAVLEASLEPWLRIKLLLGKIDLPGYNAHWVAHLPPPGEFGKAQYEYKHFAHQLAWLKKPVPGLTVNDNGLVTFAEPDEPQAVEAAE